MKIYATREEWLVAAVAEFAPIFAAHASPIAAKVRVTCGFPLVPSAAVQSANAGQTLPALTSRWRS